MIEDKSYKFYKVLNYPQKNIFKILELDLSIDVVVQDVAIFYSLIKKRNFLYFYLIFIFEFIYFLLCLC